MTKENATAPVNKNRRKWLRRIACLFVLTLLAAVGIVGWMWWNHIRIHGSSEPFEFVSFDGTVLRGEVRLPHKPGPHPAVVLLHGSGPAQISEVDYYYDSNTFLKKGFAVLAYDKRGAGQSDGDFATATYADFIEDILAGVRALRARSDIEDDKIGLFATSEGGWLAPEVAVRDGRIRFVIMKSGPPMIAHQALRWEIRNELVADGVTDEDLIEKYLDLRHSIWTYYRDAAAANDPLTDRRTQLEAELQAFGDSHEAISIKIAEFEQEKFRRWAADIFYDPTPYLLTMKIPMLAIYGRLDQNVPTESAVEILNGLRETTGNVVDIEVYPDRDHYFFEWRNILTMGMPSDYFEKIGNWAAKNIDRAAEDPLKHLD